LIQGTAILPESSDIIFRRCVIKNKLIVAIIELLKVKSIVTLIIIGVMAYLVIRGDVGVEAFMGIAGCVITYYFTR